MMLPFSDSKHKVCNSTKVILKHKPTKQDTQTSYTCSKCIQSTGSLINFIKRLTLQFPQHFYFIFHYIFKSTLKHYLFQGKVKVWPKNFNKTGSSALARTPTASIYGSHQQMSGFEQEFNQALFMVVMERYLVPN